MEISQEWEIKLIEEARKLVNYGFGEIYVEIKSLADSKVTILIQPALSHKFFVRRELDIDISKLL